MTGRDRLLEMKQLSGMEEGILQRKPDTAIPDNSLEQFLENVDAIRHVLMTLNMDRETIRKEQEDSLASGCADQLKCRRVNEHGDQFIRQARVVRQRLREATEDLKNYPENTFGTGRARHEQVRALVASFETIMAKFSEDHTEYKNRAGLKVAAYLRKQNIEVTDDQIDYAIENGSLFQLTRNITMRTEQKKSLFDDVKNRATDIMIIEKQIQEVAELFEDLHSMIQHQGETIDRIETSVCNATEYAGRAERNVKEAVQLRRKSYKWKIIICILLLILVLFVLAMIKVLSPI
ncbi:hypothetical protein GCK72_001522 [Caenorhabditis remanei]|uniref:t-SNARE coiled-coil homology domain-containing protein n=1 Tax=Caenorhabditis remanei TaxID=31234 RepID=A0A6A5HPY2_CAERE|nr:hypothetical protein GCK72_001522 [Caenorhabditis remanei]KAF1769705.1 hypothetical protein GCK72_001522 [Caenorhabditis remanei]